MTSSRSDTRTGRRPLAQRVRPQALQDMAGGRALADSSIMQAVLAGEMPPNLLFWGPPGSGKTTVARLIGLHLDLRFEHRSAIETGVKQIREIGASARGDTGGGPLFATEDASNRKPLLLFLDEIHHFNKSQQDVLLRDLEEGNLYLIGATTENPSFSLNAALLSRLTVVRLEAATDTDVEQVLARALTHSEGLDGQIALDDAARDTIVASAGGDYRVALGLLEQAAAVAEAAGVARVDQALVQELLLRNPQQYDRSGDNHYDAISAMIKSLRGSDPDAALYWLAYMYESGEDPLYLARRLVIFASEDIGNADPQALPLAMAAHQAYERVGRAEGWIPLAQAATYLATAPKSNAAYVAYKKAAALVRDSSHRPDVPWHLRNKPTGLLKELAQQQGGQPYDYPHDHVHGFAAGVSYLPAQVAQAAGRPWYRPVARGHEKEIQKRLAFFQRLNGVEEPQD